MSSDHYRLTSRAQPRCKPLSSSEAGSVDCQWFIPFCPPDTQQHTCIHIPSYVGLQQRIAIRKAEWETVKLFSRTLAVLLSNAEPERFIATMSKAKRKGLIFIDWLRNERGATAVALYSLRARPEAQVAVPVTWDELASVPSAGAFDITSVVKRLETPCPLQEISRRSAPFDSKVLTRLEKMLAS
ncbi:MAG: hypothetical protein ACK4GC_05630 [Paracoccaceae bacterium]